MQSMRLAPSSGRLAFIVAVGFAAAALSVIPRAAAPMLTLPLPQRDAQESGVPSAAPVEIAPALPLESVTPAAPASGETTAPAQPRERTAPATAAPANPVAPTAAPVQTAPQREPQPPSTSGGGIMSIAPEDGAPVAPNPRFR